MSSLFLLFFFFLYLFFSFSVFTYLSVLLLVDADETHGVQIDPVKVPQGPVTRARSKRFKESLQALVRAIQTQEKPPIEGIEFEDPGETTKVLPSEGCALAEFLV